MRFRLGYTARFSTVLFGILIASATQAQVVIDFEDVSVLQPGEQLINTVPNATFNQVSQGFNFGWQVFPGFGDTHGHLSRAGVAELADKWIASNNPLATNPPGPTDADTTYVVTDDSFSSGNFLEIWAVDGSPFTLQSFEVAESFGPQKSAQLISVYGFFSDPGDSPDLTLADLSLLDIALVGEDFNQVFLPDDPFEFTQFQLVTLGAEWTGLNTVIFDGNGATDTFSDYFAIDNIAVDTPVITDPPPPTGDPSDPTQVSEPSSLAIFGFSALLLGWVARQRDFARASSLVR